MIQCLYLLHGWSYDASFWQPLLAQLPDFKAVLLEKGYNGPASTPAPPEEPYLAVGHSAGTLSLLASKSPTCCGLVAINGFARFSQGPDHPEGIPARLLDRMSRRLEQNPEAVLRSFRQMCGDDRTPLPASPNVPALQAGLTQLATKDQTPHLAHWQGRLDSFTGERDPLAPARHGLPAPARSHLLPGGHLLPLTHPTLCAQRLRAIALSYDS